VLFLPAAVPMATATLAAACNAILLLPAYLALCYACCCLLLINVNVTATAGSSVLPNALTVSGARPLLLLLLLLRCAVRSSSLLRGLRQLLVNSCKLHLQLPHALWSLAAGVACSNASSCRFYALLRPKPPSCCGGLLLRLRLPCAVCQRVNVVWQHRGVRDVRAAQPHHARLAAGA
jgi:hypothetical protein